MITTEEIKKEADDYIKPIYAATILGQIEWADNIENFCTVDIFNGYAFQIDVNQDTFHVWRNDVDILFFDYGEMGNKLIEYLLLKRDRNHLNVFKESLKALTEHIESKPCLEN